jgi:hypothetical protein
MTTTTQETGGPPTDMVFFFLVGGFFLGAKFHYFSTKKLENFGFSSVNSGIFLFFKNPKF